MHEPAQDSSRYRQGLAVRRSVLGDSQSIALRLPGPIIVHERVLGRILVRNAYEAGYAY